MAKKAVKKAEYIYTCRDCVHAYDFHELNYKGEYFMCKCHFHKYSKFLNKSYCDNFKKNG